jgi:hypothetical protein
VSKPAIDAIIAGAAKCGSTALFAYLADHPDVCPAIDKELNYFRPRQDPSPGRKRRRTRWAGAYAEGGLEGYRKLFPCKAAAIYLEGSISYMRSPNTPPVLREYLPDARLMFILRHPVDRFISNYHFARQRYEIAPTMSLAAYWADAMDRERQNLYSEANVGLYAKHLARFLACFPRDQILLLRYLDLRQTPRALMYDVCRFLNIDPGFYERYGFSPRNVSEAARASRLDETQLRRVEKARKVLIAYPRLYHLAKQIHERFWLTAYQALNHRPIRPDERVVPSEELRREMETYYAEDVAQLDRIVGVTGWLGVAASLHWREMRTAEDAR